MRPTAAALVAVLLLAFTFVRAEPPQSQPAATPAGEKGDKEKDKGKPGDDRSSVSEHEVTVAGGRKLRYKATAGTYALKGDDGKPKADVFYVAYEQLPAAAAGGDDGGGKPATRPADAAATRPVTFVFNGGPGAAAVWLHLGTAGPWRVQVTDEGDATPPPYRLVENAATWLDATDLVFIDPVGTGYSRPAPGEKQEQFSGVQEDVQWVSEFIRLYTTRNRRWLSPKFLAGESYGTTRAAALSEYLLDRQGVALNGIVFISTVLNFQTISFADGNDLPFVLYLPTYTAAAWYHKKLPPDLQGADFSKTLKEAEQWAVTDYAAALARAASLPADERAAVVKRLARYTGLPESVVDKADLRVDSDLFRSTLLGDSRRVAGRFDARLAGYNPDPLSRFAAFDPSFPQFLAAYTAAFNEYARRDLKWESDTQYEVLTGRVHPWNFGRAGNGYLNVADNLQSAMRKNPHLKVLFASGLFDLATPYLGTTYTVNHLDLPPDLRKNVAQTFYPGGHMMYHHRPTLDKLHDDIAAFIGSAGGRP